MKEIFYDFRDYKLKIKNPLTIRFLSISVFINLPISRD